MLDFRIYYVNIFPWIPYEILLTEFHIMDLLIYKFNYISYGMDPELTKLIKETFRLSKENNEMLHKVRGVQKRDALFSLLKWLMIVAIGVGSFYFLQPYIDLVQQFIQETGTTINKFNSFLPKK